MPILLWNRLKRRLRVLLRRADVESELSDEIRLHLDMESEDLMRQGKTRAEARREARLRLGGVEQTREAVRAARVLHWLESIGQDIRYGLRQFRRAPGLFLAVVASLALGLGANTAIFSLIDAAILRPLPVVDPDLLIQLEWQNDGMPADVPFMLFTPAQTEDGLVGTVVSEPLFRRFASEQSAFSSLIGVFGNSHEVAISTTTGTGSPEVNLRYVSGNFFDGLGLRPVIGRFFVEEDDLPGAEVTIVVSYRFWSGYLGRDPNAIGQIVRVNDEPARIVGVAPAGFFGLNRGEWVDVYQPLATYASFQAGVPPVFRNYWSVTMLGRLTPGASASDAASRMNPLFRNLVAETTGTPIEESLEFIPRAAGAGLSRAGRRAGLDTVSQALWILMLLVGVLLAIVCANVANLLLSRSEARRRESAVRLALGVGRGRLIRQHLVESGMLAVMGGAAGLALGGALAHSIHTLFQTGQGPGVAFAVAVDWRVLGYAGVASMATAVIFGLAPAWTAARSKVNDALKTQSRSVLGGGLRLPKLLVSIQFALSFAGLVGAGLLGRSLGNLYSTDLGFDSGQLSYATVRPYRAGVDPGPYMERLEQEVAAIPGVLAVVPVGNRPMDGGGGGGFVQTPGGPPANTTEGIGNPEAFTLMVHGGPGFLEVLGIPLLRGRTLEAADPCRSPAALPGASGNETGRPVCNVVVDERFAAAFFPGEVPVGQQFEIPGIIPSFNYRIVGLAADARVRALREDGRPTVYWLGPAGFSMDHLAIRAQLESDALARAVQQAVAHVDPAVPLAEFHTQSGLIDRQLRIERLLAFISGAFSVVALVLAAVGLGGLLAYSVARRTNEIGIRMALGASGREVRRMVLTDSLRMVGAGVLVGVPLAWGVGRYLESQLFGLDPIDPTTAAAALAALVAIAAVAALIPARRASRVDPLTALREE